MCVSVDWLESSFVEKPWEVLVDTKVSMSSNVSLRQCVLEAKNTNGFLCCIRKALVAAQKDDPSSPLQGVTHLECFVQFWAP